VQQSLQQQLSFHSNDINVGQVFESAWDLLLVRVAGSTLVGFTSNTVRSPTSDGQNSRLNWAQYYSICKAFAPTAMCLFVANYYNGVALQLSGITLTYVVKATIPVFTVLHASLVQRETFSYKVYLSIVPTVGGVALAAWSDSEVSLLA
jgi:drug/metabolite transporter (DMT)-like permease